MNGLHEPVLRRETIDHIAEPGAAGNFVDATFGRGGHSRALLGRVGPDARLLVLDRDAEAFACAQALAAEDARVVARRSALWQHRGDFACGGHGRRAGRGDGHRPLLRPAR